MLTVPLSLIDTSMTRPRPALNHVSYRQLSCTPRSSRLNPASRLRCIFLPFLLLLAASCRFLPLLAPSCCFLPRLPVLSKCSCSYNMARLGAVHIGHKLYRPHEYSISATGQTLSAKSISATDKRSHIHIGHTFVLGNMSMVTWYG